jgi:hypothetical protein
MAASLCSEDVETAYEAGFNPEEDPEDPAVRQLWLDLASGAESGEWRVTNCCALPAVRAHP